LHLGADVLVPDYAGWRRTRMPSVPATAYFPLAPDWVCEIISPSTAALDRARKVGVYAREQVGHAWLIDPSARTLEILRLEAGRWVIVSTDAGDVTVRAEPFAEIEIGLADLWVD
jgi:Uma2 family endonuclease